MAASLARGLMGSGNGIATVAGKLVIQAEPKADVVHWLGRSPDRGDAVVMAFTKGGNNASWQAEPTREIKVIRSHMNKRCFNERR